MFAFFLAALLLDPSATLRPDAFDAPAATSVAESVKANAPVEHQHHQHQVEAPKPAPPPPKAKATAKAKPTAPKKVTPKATTPGPIVYTCPMHPEVMTSKPGTCPKCGMTLVKRTKR